MLLKDAEDNRAGNVMTELVESYTSSYLDYIDEDFSTLSVNYDIATSAPAVDFSSQGKF